MKIPAKSLLNAAIGRFDGIVSARVAAPAERRRHAAAMAALVAGSLGSALLIPAMAFGGGMHHAVAAAIASSVCLVLAATLAATAALEVVMAALLAGVTMGLTLGAIFGGGSVSPFMLLLPIAPLEALLAGRRQLFRTSFGVVSLGLCFVIAATLAGLASPPAPSGAPFLGAATLLVGYAVLRGFRRPKAERRREAVEAISGSGLLRFAPDGALIEAAADARSLFGDRLDGDRLPFALSLVHVADRVGYLAAFGEMRTGANRARCEARLWDATANTYADRVLELVAARTGNTLLSVAMTMIEAASPDANGAEDLEAALEAARAGSEAKSSFLAMVSHELRTPLNAIIGFSDVLDRELFGGFPDPRQKEYVGLIRQSGEHLLSVVNGLLDISKIEAGRYELVPEPFDIADVLEPAVATVRCEAERKGLRLAARNECGSGMLVADRRAVHQILLNLIANAVKFTESGEVEIAVREAGGFMRIVVSDTGIGIPAADIPRLGQPFTQGSSGLTRRYPGTGLGLSLVKGFAELHRGSLGITSEQGRGTVVEVKLSLDCTRGVDQNEPEQKIVSLKHARSTETHAPSFEARRSA